MNEVGANHWKLLLSNQYAVQPVDLQSQVAA